MDQVLAALRSRPSQRSGTDLDVLASCLAELPFFAGADFFALRLICGVLGLHVASPGEAVLHVGEITDRMYLLLRGRCSLVRHSRKEGFSPRPPQGMEPGQALCEASLVVSGRRSDVELTVALPGAERGLTSGGDGAELQGEAAAADGSSCSTSSGAGGGGAADGGGACFAVLTRAAWSDICARAPMQPEYAEARMAVLCCAARSLAGSEPGGRTPEQADDLAALLRNMPALSSAPPAVLRCVSECALLRCLPPGTVLFEEATRAEAQFVVLGGEVQTRSLRRRMQKAARSLGRAAMASLRLSRSSSRRRPPGPASARAGEAASGGGGGEQRVKSVREKIEEERRAREALQEALAPSREGVRALEPRSESPQPAPTPQAVHWMSEFIGRIRKQVGGPDDPSAAAASLPSPAPTQPPRAPAGSSLPTPPPTASLPSPAAPTTEPTHAPSRAVTAWRRAVIKVAQTGGEAKGIAPPADGEPSGSDGMEAGPKTPDRPAEGGAADGMMLEYQRRKKEESSCAAGIGELLGGEGARCAYERGIQEARTRLRERHGFAYEEDDGGGEGVSDGGGGGGRAGDGDGHGEGTIRNDGKGEGCDDGHGAAAEPDSAGGRRLNGTRSVADRALVTYPVAVGDGGDAGGESPSRPGVANREGSGGGASVGDPRVRLTFMDRNFRVAAETVSFLVAVERLVRVAVERRNSTAQRRSSASGSAAASHDVSRASSRHTTVSGGEHSHPGCEHGSSTPGARGGLRSVAWSMAGGVEPAVTAGFGNLVFDEEKDLDGIIDEDGGAGGGDEDDDRVLDLCEEQLDRLFGPPTGKVMAGAVVGEVIPIGGLLLGAPGGAAAVESTRKRRMETAIAGPLGSDVLVVSLAALRRGLDAAREEVLSERGAALAALEPLRGLKGDAAAAIALEAELLTVDGNQVIVRQGQPVDALYVVLEGELRLLDDPESAAAAAAAEAAEAVAAAAAAAEATSTSGSPRPATGSGGGAVAPAAAAASSATAASLASPFVRSRRAAGSLPPLTLLGPGGSFGESVLGYPEDVAADAASHVPSTQRDVRSRAGRREAGDGHSSDAHDGGDDSDSGGGDGLHKSFVRRAAISGGASHHPDRSTTAAAAATAPPSASPPPSCARHLATAISSRPCRLLTLRRASLARHSSLWSSLPPFAALRREALEARRQQLQHTLRHIAGSGGGGPGTEAAMATGGTGAGAGMGAVVAVAVAGAPMLLHLTPSAPALVASSGDDDGGAGGGEAEDGREGARGRGLVRSPSMPLPHAAARASQLLKQMGFKSRTSKRTAGLFGGASGGSGSGDSTPERRPASVATTAAGVAGSFLSSLPSSPRVSRAATMQAILGHGSSDRLSRLGALLDSSGTGTGTGTGMAALHPSGSRPHTLTQVLEDVPIDLRASDASRPASSPSPNPIAPPSIDATHTAGIAVDTNGVLGRPAPPPPPTAPVLSAQYLRLIRGEMEAMAFATTATESPWTSVGAAALTGGRAPPKPRVLRTSLSGSRLSTANQPPPRSSLSGPPSVSSPTALSGRPSALASPLGGGGGVVADALSPRPPHAASSGARGGAAMARFESLERRVGLRPSLSVLTDVTGNTDSAGCDGSLTTSTGAGRAPLSPHGVGRISGASAAMLPSLASAGASAAALTSPLSRLALAAGSGGALGVMARSSGSGLPPGVAMRASFAGVGAPSYVAYAQGGGGGGDDGSAAAAATSSPRSRFSATHLHALGARVPEGQSAWADSPQASVLTPRVLSGGADGAGAAVGGGGGSPLSRVTAPPMRSSWDGSTARQLSRAGGGIGSPVGRMGGGSSHSLLDFAAATSPAVTHIAMAALAGVPVSQRQELQNDMEQQRAIQRQGRADGFR